MQLVRIAGPTDAMLRLHEVDGLDFERTSANKLDEDTWQVAGYATDEALAELTTRGLTTELVVPADQLEEQRRILFAAITREEVEDPGGTSPGDDPGGTAPGDDPPGETSAGDDPEAGEG